MQIIPKNAASPAPIPFSLVDATDFATPENIDPTGVKPTVYIGGTALTGTAADIVEVDGPLGLYQWTPTQSQINVTQGLVLRGYIKPTGCAITEFFAQIGPADALEDGDTSQEIAQEVLFTLAGHRGHKIEDDGTNIKVSATDGTTNVVTQPRTRAGSAQNPITRLG